MYKMFKLYIIILSETEYNLIFNLSSDNELYSI